MSFGLKTLFVGMGALCVALALLTAMPPRFAVPILILIAVTVAAVCTVGVIVGRGSARAFCVGALFPAGATFIALTWMLFAWFLVGPYEIKDFPRLIDHLNSLGFTLRVWSPVSWIMELVVGLVTVRAWQAFQRSDSN